MFLHYQGYAALTGAVILLVAALIARHKTRYGDFADVGDTLVFLLWTLTLVALGVGVVLFLGARKAAR